MRLVPLDSHSITAALAEMASGQSGISILALLPEAEKEALPGLQAACREQGISLTGAIFPALISDRCFVNNGVWLLPLARGARRVIIPDLQAAGVDMAARIAGDVRKVLDDFAGAGAKPTLFMIFDAMVPNLGSLLEALYLDLANNVDYSGVCAGSESFQPMPCLFDETRVFGGGMVGVLLPGDVPTAMAHGFTQPERAMSATSTDGNRIAMIDWEPAFSVYQRVIKAEYGIDLTRENFYHYAVHFPFGLQCANGEVVVRIPVGLNDDGSLYCVGEVPENALLVLLKAPEAGADGCLDVLLDRMSAAPDHRKLLTFYCAGRRMHLAEGAERELKQLTDVGRFDRIGGAMSLGEIGSIRRGGYPMFHNATLVCRPWS